MSASRIALSMAGLAVAAIALAWLLGTEERLPSERELPTERARGSEELAIGEGSETPRGLEDPAEIRRGFAASDAAAAPTLAERARETAGVLVRIVDRSGQPLGGVPVGLQVQREGESSPRLGVIGVLEREAAPVLGETAHGGAAPMGPVPMLRAMPLARQGFRHRNVRGISETEDVAEPRIYDELQWSDERGEALFTRAAVGKDERWSLEPALPCTSRIAREVPAGALPATVVELELEGLQRFEVAATADEEFAAAPWHVWIHAEREPTEGDARTWTLWDAIKAFRPGAVLEVCTERSARVMVEAWPDLTFTSRRRHVLAARGPTGASERLVLDAREHLSRVDVELEHPDGRRPSRGACDVILWDGQSARFAEVNLGARGALSVYLDPREPLGPDTHLRFTLHAGSVHDANDAHLALASPFAPGVTYAMGVIVLGSGPLLYAGEVVDGEGMAVSRAKVHCVELEETHEADERGHFERRGYARERELVLSVEARGYFGLPRTVEAGSTGVRFVLQRSADLQATLVLPEVLDTPRFEARFESAAMGVARLERSGRVSGLAVTFEDLPATSGALSILWNGEVLHRADLVLSAGSNDAGRIDLGAAFELVEIEVLRADGSPKDGVPCVFAWFDGDDRAHRSYVLTDRNGRAKYLVPRRAARWTASVEQSELQGVPGVGGQRRLRLPH